MKQMSNAERATKFADFINAVTTYAPILDEAQNQCEQQNHEGDDSMFEYLSRVTPVLDLSPMADLSFRDAVLVWTRRTENITIAKAVTALLIRPIDDLDNADEDKAQAFIHSAGAASAVAMMFSNQELAYQLLGRIKFYCVTHDTEFPNFHNLLVEGLLLSVVDEEGARQLLIDSVSNCDNDKLWSDFEVALDEEAMWNDLNKAGDSNE
jgi:hypothetical protein